MKLRLIALVGALGLLFGQASAQSVIVDNPDNRAYWGIRADVDVVLPGKWHPKYGSEPIKMFSNGIGFSIGGVYNIPLVANLYVEPGVSLFYDTYRFDDLTVVGDDDYTEKNPAVKKFGLRVPVMIGYHFDLWENGGISVFTGPELSVGLSGKIGVHNKELFGDDFPTNLYSDGFQRRTDCAWKVGVGVPVGQFLIGVEGAFGLVDLKKGNGITYHENRAALKLGYNF